MFNKKVLISYFATCTVLLVLSVVTITILVFRKNECAASQKNKCETFGCVKAAAQIVSYIDENIDPCENFYQFANGRYITEKTNEDWSSDDQYYTVLKRINRNIGLLLESDSTERSPMRLAKNFYRSCYGRSLSKKQKTKILHSLDGWRVFVGEPWPKLTFSLSELLIKVKQLGFGTDILFETSVYVDPKNKTNRWLAIKRGNYDNSELSTDDYNELMKDLPKQFANESDDKAKDRIATEMESVLEFENKLRYFKLDVGGVKQESEEYSSNEDGNSDDANDDDVENYDDDEYNNNDGNDYDEEYDDNDDDEDSDDDDESMVSYQKTTITELRKSYPYLNWLKYFNGILPSEMKVTENEPILNFDPEFFQALPKISKTERTWSNYIILRVMYKIHQMETQNVCYNNRDCCVQSTSKKFPLPVTILYSLKYFNETLRQAALSLVQDVQDAFIDMLRSATWMANSTRTRAIEKAKNVVARVGYANGINEINELMEYYKDLKLESDNFINNTMQWNVFNQNQMFKTLRKPENRSGLESMLDSQPNEANAYYTRSTNTIYFPVGILHELFFAVDRPQYINYASMGSTVGHEITHGFDSSGQKYDLNGNLANWWDLETEATYKKNSKCFVEQYRRYVVDEKINLMVNGAKTKKENIADNGGTIAAYHAYQNWIKRNGPEKLVPGIKYNQRQLFWISYAQAEGGVFGKDNQQNYIRNGVPAPSQFRVNGVVTNSPEFAKDFSCAVGSKMNPKNKCKIW